jgi:ribulose-phosphate 3-epimerase
MAILAPSVLSADFANLGRDVQLISEAGAEYIHLDVMDGTFVPNISFGAGVIKKIRPYSDKVFDVHMMVEEPSRYVDDFVEAGADIIVVHQEACLHLDRTLNKIKDEGVKAGVALNPATSLHTLDYVLDQVDMILLMSVNPGFGNQKFIPYVVDKIRQLKSMLDERGLQVPIEVDGGVSLQNAQELLDAGASVLVAGSAVFKGDAQANVKAFQEILHA